MKGWGVLVFVVLFASVCSAQENEFAVSLPEGFFGGLFHRVLFPLFGTYLRGFGNNFPPECCYHGKGDLKIQMTSLATRNLTGDAVASSSSHGISLVADGGWDLDMHFKLCSQIGRTCTPLFFCNDDVTLHFTLKMTTLLQAGATTEGKLNLTGVGSSLVLDVDYGNLCLTVKQIISGVIDDLNKEFTIIFPKLLNVLLGVIGDAVSMPISIGNAQIQAVYSDSETGTTTTGLAAGGSLSVTNKNNGNHGTFTPSSPLPSLITTPQPPNEEEFYIADSIPNNILQVLFDGTFPDQFKIDVYLQGNLFKLHLNLRESPQVSFSPAGNSIIIKTREVIQDGFLRVDFDVDTQIFFGFGHDKNQIYLILSPDNFIFDVEILPPVDPFQNTTEFIDQLVEAQWNQYIPVLNNFFASHPIPLPPFPFFSFPGMQDFNGYTRIFLQNIPRASPFDSLSNSLSVPGSPLLVAMVNGVIEGLSDPVHESFENLGQRLSETLQNPSLQAMTNREGEQNLSSFPKTKPNGRKDFYCPPIIPGGFSVETCPDSE